MATELEPLPPGSDRKSVLRGRTQLNGEELVCDLKQLIVLLLDGT